jgi:plastocyanin
MNADRESEDVSRRGMLRRAGSGLAASAIAAGAGGTASAQEDGGDGAGGGGGATHTVEMTDGLVFEPESLTVAPGDTVVWENVGSIGHSVTGYEDEIPDGAAYFASGGFDSEQAARDAYSAGNPDSGDVPGGESYEHTFETEGEYGYFCIPHEQAGMVASVTVEEGAGEDGGAASSPAVPDAVKRLAVATTGTLAAVVALVFLFLKYGGSPTTE